MAVNNINTLRLLGMSSGLDTDSIIESMMQIEQLKVDREYRSLTTLQWKQDQYNDVAAQLKEFVQKYTSVLSSDNMLSSKPYNQFSVTTSGSYKDAVTITAGAGATTGTMTINGISQLAEAANASSSSGVSKSGGQLSVDNTTKLKDLNFAKDLEFDELGQIKFIINGELFTFSEDDTLQNMLKTVNSNENAGVTMSYSRLTDKFTIASNETGAKKSDGTVNAVSIFNVSGNAFGADSAFGIEGGTYINGKDAIFTVNGTQVTRSSNSFTIDGISYTLNEVTADDANIKVTISRDIDSTVDYIKSFIDSYNSLITTLQNIVSEKKTSDEKSYEPLTDTEKAELTEKQITDWEAIAKKGLLYNDSGIQNLLTELRRAFYDTVEGTGLSAASIGLQTGSWYDKGLITVDEELLREALEKDPDVVTSIFTNFSSATAGSSEYYKESGLLNRISDSLSNYYSNTQSTTLDTIQRQMTRLDDRIETLETKMADRMERYYLKFAALESMMSQLNSQSDYITSMLSSM